MNKVVLFPLLLHLGSATDECPLECQNGTHCIVGEVDTAGLPFDPVTEEILLHPNLHEDGWKCDCPLGLAGLRCDRKFISCDKGSSQGCYHGGLCLEGLTDQYGDHQFFCNCNHAIEAAAPLPGEPVAAERYVGQYCEHAVLETDKCEGDFNTFCVNGGTCRTEGDDIDLVPCECTDGFTGRYCEYKKSEVPDCDLDCGEHGICQLGTKLQTEFEKKMNISPHASFMHCSCRDGFLGFNCDVPATICGDDGNHWCLNGGECRETSGSNETSTWECDCSSSDPPATGKACEQRATSICPVSTKTDPNSMHLGFCVNGGVCQVAFGTGEQFCDCPNTLPSGPHCESQTIGIVHTPIKRKTPVPTAAPQVAPSAAPQKSPTTSPEDSPTVAPQADNGIIVDEKPDFNPGGTDITSSPTLSPQQAGDILADDKPRDQPLTNTKLQPETSSKTSLGPIVGGVVGAVLVAVLAAAIFMRRGRRTTGRKEAPSSNLNLHDDGGEPDRNDLFLEAVGQARGDFAAPSPIWSSPSNTDRIDII